MLQWLTMTVGIFTIVKAKMIRECHILHSMDQHLHTPVISCTDIAGFYDKIFQ